MFYMCCDGKWEIKYHMNIKSNWINIPLINLGLGEVQLKGVVCCSMVEARENRW